VSVLDAVRDSAARLRKRLSSTDRQRLDQHLTSISEVRARLQTVPPPPSQACVQRPAPAVQNVGDEPKEAVVKVMNDLIVLAFACDLTRVASLALTQLSANPVYAAMGHEKPLHGLSHDTTRLDKYQLHECVKFHVAMFSDLLQKLKAAPEGPGNLLDNSCLLLSSDLSDGQTHTLQEYPLVIGGRGGGVLAYPGVHVREVGANTSNVLLSCMRACGVPTPTIGADTCASSTPCAGVLA